MNQVGYIQQVKMIIVIINIIICGSIVHTSNCRHDVRMHFTQIHLCKITLKNA